MMKAANHQILKKEDFIKLTEEHLSHAKANANNRQNAAGINMPNLPTIVDMDDDELDESPLNNNMKESGKDAFNKDAPRIQPLNILLLKDIMNKKIHKMSNLPVVISIRKDNTKNQVLPFLNSTNSKTEKSGGLKSSTSIKSNGSGNNENPH
jgi:hypothetical protein